jgi:endonuclease/exonuclease/phosphatase family metal-dependent hydrolase
MTNLQRALLFSVGALALSALYVRSLFWFPEDVEPAELVCPADTPPAPRNTALKVLVWNIQYAAGRQHHFFYDGGTEVSVPAEDVVLTLDRIAEVVRKHDPDIILWQEVDRGSARTGRVDQVMELLARTPYPCHASTPYHRVGYVPHPSHDHMGKVDMHLTVFSRHKLTEATRIQLPLLVEPWWRQMFNLRRALLDVRVQVEGGGELRLFNTHLSAFSKGDGSLDQQMAVLDEHLGAAEGERIPWLLGGDLNSLPPGDDAARLGPDAIYYAEKVPPVQRLFDRYRPAIPAVQLMAEPRRWRTYQPFASAQPDRVLDYVFASRVTRVGNVEVVQALNVSDHLPIYAELTLP